MSSSNRPLRIGFLTSKDPTDRGAWSGTMFCMATALAKSCGDVVPLGPVESPRRKRLRTMGMKFRTIFGKRYDAGHSVLVASEYAKAFGSKLRGDPVDVIFAPSAATEIALLKTTIPIIYASDATFAAMWGYYDDFSDMLSISRLEGNFVERRAIRKAARIIYSSEWARSSAIRDYGADPKNLYVIPFGANLDVVPTASSILTRTREPQLRLLFVGVDWDRKGGPIAVRTFDALRSAGIPTVLTIIGCKPAGLVATSDLRIIPFLDKNDPAQSQLLIDLYSKSDILLLPTRAECSAIAFCEAAAYGLPVFSTQTGGVPSVVRDGVTGILLPLRATEQDYARDIAALWRDPQRLNAMTLASRKAFEQTLNWNSWGEATGEVIRSAVSGNQE